MSYVTSQNFLAENIYISLIKGGLLNYIIMKVIISTHRDVILDVQGSNIVRVYLAQITNISLTSLFAVVWSTSSGNFE